jgi:predicted nuclease of predicted toxin-antitoxin system
MKFLLDQGLPRSTVTILQSSGHIAQHVGDLRLNAATDVAILDAARDRDAVVVTLDADFHTILAQTRAVSPSVIRLRIEGLKAPDVADILHQVAAAADAELSAGAAVSVSHRGFRIRMLPLV